MGRSIQTPCSCGKFYIGQTKNNFARLKEYIKATTYQHVHINQSSVLEHSFITKHIINFKKQKYYIIKMLLIDFVDNEN